MTLGGCPIDDYHDSICQDADFQLGPVEHHLERCNGSQFCCTTMAVSIGHVTWYTKICQQIMGSTLCLHTGKLTWIPKIAISERRYILETIILGIYVRFCGGLTLRFANFIKQEGDK